MLKLWGSIIGRKWTIVAIAAIAISLFVAVQRWGARQWAKGEEQGRQHVAAQLAKEKEAEWQAREKQIEDAAAMVQDQLRVLTHATAEITNARTALRSQYNLFTAQASVRREEDEKIIASVPDYELRAAIRAISAELAAGVSRR